MSRTPLSFSVDVRTFRLVENGEVAVYMLVKLPKFLLHVKTVSLILLDSHDVVLVAHLAVIATVKLKHVTQGLLSLYLNLSNTHRAHQ